jgi:tRNA-splicing ligase RtcB (3'-phosphate/5'-hydroxy nucleic acid ligase)
MVNMAEQSDPYRERARQMAIEAGQDPDSRIFPPGDARGMPVWCTYWNAARKEKELAQMANLRPQEDRFKDAPLTIFGTHAGITIEQMRDCMSVGNAVRGVLCADGHLGYAQPVGGVIAYEKQISISGVGFDIGCGNMAARLDTKF